VYGCLTVKNSWAIKGDDVADRAGRNNLLRTILFHQIYLTFIVLYTIITLF